MGRVIDLEAWRCRRSGTAVEFAPEPEPTPDHGPNQRLGRGPGISALARLERAVARLDPLIRRGTGRMGPRVETELLTITGAVTAGRVRDAAERAERLAERLEHPSSLAAR
ncbi:MAG: hypothetical protein ACRDHS_09380 [Actinomycetota bacterium]